MKLSTRQVLTHTKENPSDPGPPDTSLRHGGDSDPSVANLPPKSARAARLVVTFRLLHHLRR